MQSEVSGFLSTPAEITAPDERVSAYGWKALAGSLMGFSMDGFDMLILGFMLAAISADLGLTSTKAGSWVTWTMLGAVTGGLIFGPMSDRTLSSVLRAGSGIVARYSSTVLGAAFGDEPRVRKVGFFFPE